MNRLTIITAISVLLVIAIISCDDYPLEPKVDPFQYPLSPGNNWSYEGRVYHTDFSPPDLGHILDDTIYQTSFVFAESLQTVMDSIEVMRIIEKFYSSAALDSAYYLSYYKNEDDGLYYYGTSGYTYCAPKQSVNQKSIDYNFGITVPNVFVNNFKPEPFEFEYPPLKSLDYSFKIDQEWSYLNKPVSMEDPFQIDKKFIGFERIRVPAGIFDCIVVQWIYKDHSEIEFFDYYSNIGLVKRKYMIKNLLYAGYNFPQDTGRATMIQEYNLTDYVVSASK